MEKEIKKMLEDLRDWDNQDDALIEAFKRGQEFEAIKNAQDKAGADL